jgi:integrase
MTTKARGPFKPKQVEALPPHPAGKRRIRYYDSENLHIAVEVMPSGNVSRSYAFHYYSPATGRPAEKSLGTIPDIGLGEARRLRDRCNELVAKGIDPKHHEAALDAQQAKEAMTFTAASAAFLADLKKLGHVRESSLYRYGREHAAIGRSAIGRLPIGALSANVETVKDWLLGHPAAQARSLCRYTARVFAWAIMCGRATTNPAEAMMKARWLPAHQEEHYRAVTEPAHVGELLRAIRRDMTDIGRLASEFLALTFVRPANVWEAQWQHIDMDRAMWTIPAAFMKKDRPHIVPLSRQALAILRTMRAAGGVGPYVFGGIKPASNRMFKLLAERIGWHNRMTAHGFRAMASTILHGDGEHGFRPGDLNAYRAIEEQLAHRNGLASVSGIARKSSGPYDRNDMMALRIELMAWWADRLDLMAAGLRVAEAAA